MQKLESYTDQDRADAIRILERADEVVSGDYFQYARDLGIASERAERSVNLAKAAWLAANIAPAGKQDKLAAEILRIGWLPAIGWSEKRGEDGRCAGCQVRQATHNC